MSSVKLALGLVVAGAVSSVSRLASAQAALGADLGATYGLDAHEFGQAADVHLGFRFGLWRASPIHAVIFQPEAIAGYRHLAGFGDARDDLHEARIGAGLRLGCLCPYVEPFLLFHLNGAAGTRAFAPLYDFGLIVDWRFTGSSLGLHATYAVLRSEGPERWVEFGPHFEYRWFAW